MPKKRVVMQVKAAAAAQPHAGPLKPRATNSQSPSSAARATSSVQANTPHAGQLVAANAPGHSVATIIPRASSATAAAMDTAPAVQTPPPLSSTDADTTAHRAAVEEHVWAQRAAAVAERREKAVAAKELARKERTTAVTTKATPVPSSTGADTAARQAAVEEHVWAQRAAAVAEQREKAVAAKELARKERAAAATAKAAPVTAKERAPSERAEILRLHNAAIAELIRRARVKEATLPAERTAAHRARVKAGIAALTKRTSKVHTLEISLRALGWEFGAAVQEAHAALAHAKRWYHPDAVIKRALPMKHTVECKEPYTFVATLC